jgi:hypothetical protein
LIFAFLLFLSIIPWFDNAQPSGRFGHSHPLNSREDMMSSKIPRNDPCPCGSGKKYKDRRRLRERNGHDFALRPSTRTHQLLRSLD